MSNPTATEALDSLKGILNELLVKDIKAITEKTVGEVKTGTSTVLNNWLSDQFDDKQRKIYKELQEPRFIQLETAERDLVTKAHKAVQELITIREAVSNRMEVFTGEMLSAFTLHQAATKLLNEQTITAVETVKNNLKVLHESQEREIKALQQSVIAEVKTIQERISQEKSQTDKQIRILLTITSLSLVTTLGFFIKVLFF